MKVADFLTDIGDALQEDYTTNPVWTKAEVFGYTRQALKMFCQLTQLFDKVENRLVKGATGEALVSEDFEQSYLIQFSQLVKDVVSLEDLDFVEDGWLSGSTGTPESASVVGSGSGSVVRFAPIPSSVYDGGNTASPVAGLTLTFGGNSWLVTCDRGVLITTSTPFVPAIIPVLAGPTTYWGLVIDLTGQLETSSTTPTTTTDVSLVDASGGSNDWLLTCDDNGVLRTESVYTNYGIGVAADLDFGTYQEFTAGGSANANYGIIVDAFADDSSTTPANIAKVDSVYGVSLFGRTNTEAATVWYKGSHRDLDGVYNEIQLSPGLVPVLKHGVLALAFGHDGDGKDVEKSELFKNIFFAECTSIRGIFESRWE